MTEAVEAGAQCARCGAAVVEQTVSQSTMTVDMGGPYLRVVPSGQALTLNRPCGCGMYGEPSQATRPSE